MVNKLPNSITTEELEALLQSEPKLQVQDLKAEYDPILLFISTFNIVTGRFLVEGKTLWSLFRVWHPQHFPGGYKAFKQKLYPFFSKSRGKLCLSISSRQIQDMLGVVDNPRKKMNTRYDLSSVEKFCQEMGVERGRLWVTAKNLHRLYSEKRKRIPLSKFTKICRLLFDSRTTKRETWFRVHESIRAHIVE